MRKKVIPIHCPYCKEKIVGRDNIIFHFNIIHDLFIQNPMDVFLLDKDADVVTKKIDIKQTNYSSPIKQQEGKKKKTKKYSQFQSEIIPGISETLSMFPGILNFGKN